MPLYRQRSILAILAIFAAYALVAFHLIGIEKDPDEGINLMKATLVLKGYSLYMDIWNDQPPVFTILLAGLFRLVGPSIEVARLLVLSFACILLWSFHQIIELSLDRRSALLATILLATSWMFARLSLSVMIGVPALSLALLSIYFFILSNRDSSIPVTSKWMVYPWLSGILFALSLQTKLFAAFLAPLYLLLDDGNGTHMTNRAWSRLFQYFVWLLVVLSAYILIGLISGASDYRQLVSPHASGAIRHAYIHSDLYFNNVIMLLRKDYLPLVLACLGTFTILKWRAELNGLFPLAWFILANTLRKLWATGI